MQIRSAFIFILTLSLNAFGASLSFQDIPTRIIKENGLTEVSFELKAAVYSYKQNKDCDLLLNQSLKEKKAISLSVDPKKNIILKCSN